MRKLSLSAVKTRGILPRERNKQAAEKKIGWGAFPPQAGQKGTKWNGLEVVWALLSSDLRSIQNLVCFGKI